MTCLRHLRRWRTRRLLRRHRIPLATWLQVLEAAPRLAALDRRARGRLRVLASRFLRHKVIVGADGFAPDATVRAFIAAHACLLILNLGLDWYDGWREIIVYPGPFIARHRALDQAGVLHEERRGLAGEAWLRGPVVLSWSDMDPAGSARRRRGANVLFHEFAHKLDFLDGAANGIPPLHAGNRQPAWTADFARAYAELGRARRRRASAIDAYAATSPAEFFAVATEVFFEDAQRLQRHYPAVYDELRRFYRQDPAAGLA